MIVTTAAALGGNLGQGAALFPRNESRLLDGFWWYEAALLGEVDGLVNRDRLRGFGWMEYLLAGAQLLKPGRGDENRVDYQPGGSFDPRNGRRVWRGDGSSEQMPTRGHNGQPS